MSKNVSLHECRRLYIMQVIQQATSLLISVSIQMRDTTETNNEAAHKEGNAMVHIDASVKEDGAGFGMIVLDENDNFMAAATKLIDATFEPRIGEALALCWALELLINLDITMLMCILIALRWFKLGLGEDHLTTPILKTSSMMNMSLFHFLISFSLSIVIGRTIKLHTFVEQLLFKSRITINF
ncbi:hypothetical protein RIF29_22450 [Crotalaria pallida]|uniref:RNase H type-1 domain-containing protein n=1 Tax=Crotalaria pallida TaxID=3830 RepID=A0AAN9F8V5_CROPI